MFSNFYFVKNDTIANNSATTEAKEKNKHRFGILRISDILDICFSEIKNSKILLYKICHLFLALTNLFTG